MTKVTATYQEISTQTLAWQQALAVVTDNAAALTHLWAGGDYSAVIFTGCGSTYYLSLAAAALLQELTGQPARAVPAGELVLYPQVNYPASGKILLVAVSRSAETSETIQAVKTFLQAGRGDVITISNYGNRPLAGMGRINLAIPAGQEESMAQTRSFASMYVAASAVAALLAGQTGLLAQMSRLPEIGQRLIDSYESQAEAIGRNLNLDRFYFLGSGPRYGLACETNLKMKEMTLTHSEPFHFLEFRHGPISMAGSTAAVIGLLSEASRAYEAAVLQDVAALGAQVITLSETGGDIEFNSGLPEAVRNVLYLPVLQLMAYYRAIAKGLNPDSPNNLTAVVKLEW
ncbi:MAG: Glutamine--fructose-6-phosphate aminotransferase [isomerizing] [Anaerolineae bacterium]|nr:Glutamine--fructose-6-phosphate aminotransferase [isomerizing] [Anaerolineae bacterium]